MEDMHIAARKLPNNIIILVGSEADGAIATSLERQQVLGFFEANSSLHFLTHLFDKLIVDAVRENIIVHSLSSAYVLKNEIRFEPNLEQFI